VRVIKKRIPDAPHETWLVLDGTAGQNAIQQARVFKEATGVTGLIVTKLDGTAKGGAAIAIRRELALPVRFIGVGEAMDDLQPFDPDAFIEAIFGEVER
jgi:fused signal recognition particle receptor